MLKDAIFYNWKCIFSMIPHVRRLVCHNRLKGPGSNTFHASIGALVFSILKGTGDFIWGTLYIFKKYVYKCMCMVYDAGSFTSMLL